MQDAHPGLRQGDAARRRSDGDRWRRAHAHAVREPADVADHRVRQRQSRQAAASPRSSRRRYRPPSDGVRGGSHDAWHWSGKAKVTNSRPAQAWGGGKTLGRLFGELDVKGDANGFEGRGPLTSEGLRAGAFQTVFVGNYADRVVTATHLEATHIASGAHAEGRGHDPDRARRAGAGPARHVEELPLAARGRERRREEHRRRVLRFAASGRST